MHPDPRVVGKDCAEEGARLDSGASSLQLHEAKDTTLDAARASWVRVHWSGDGSRISAEDISDDLVMERLQKIFKNLHGIPAVVPEFSADNPPCLVSLQVLSPQVLC